MAARDGRVVEAHVGGEAPPDPRPPVLQRKDAHSVVVVECQVVAFADERVACLREPVGRALDFVACLRADRVAEQRRTLEALAAALGAGRDGVTLVQRDGKAAGVTLEGPGTSQRAGIEGFHGISLLKGVGAMDGIDGYELSK